MKKELLETIDETVENICKWANEEFKEKKLTSREVMLKLEETDESKENAFNKKIEIINTLSKILQARADIERSLPITFSVNNNNK